MFKYPNAYVGVLSSAPDLYQEVYTRPFGNPGDPSWANPSRFGVPFNVGVYSTDSVPTGTENEIGSGYAAIVPNSSLDFHYRLWVIPSILQMTNPQLNSDIPFYLWNTATVPQTMNDIVIDGSDVLSFDIEVGDIVRDKEYRLVNMQIDAGEPSIEAYISFIMDSIRGTLQVLAAISETFNLIPDIPVKEVWEFKTDILKSFNGSEQRIALRNYPRIAQEFSVEILDQRQRREQYLLLRKNIVVQTIIAFYQYGAKVNGFTPAGGNRFYFDPARSNVRVGEFIALVNTTTENILLGRVDEIHVDGVTINSVATSDVDGSGQTWVAIPCYTCLVEDGSGISMNTVTGTLNIKANTFREPSLIRPNATRVVDRIDGIPFLNRRPLSGAAEDFYHRREIIDNETGLRAMSSGDKHPQVSGTRRFTIQRNQDPEEMDYWRNLFDEIKGAQKSFLISTYFPDLTIHSSSIPLADGTSQIVVNEGEVKGLLVDFDGFRRFQLEYPNKEMTNHVITSSQFNPDGTMTINFSPPVPAGAAYNFPTRLSYIMRVRSSDQITLNHYANYTEISFGITTTDE